MILDAAIDSWRSRPARERWLIGLPSAALLAVVLYIGIWEPLHGSIAHLRSVLPEREARRELIRGETAELRAQPAAPAASAANAASVQAAIERRQLQGALPALEPAGENRSRLSFARVPFHALWPLLQDLQLDKGIRIVSLRVDRPDGGNVRVDAILGTGER
jgi:type II secretory pathway component PulM